MGEGRRTAAGGARGPEGGRGRWRGAVGASGQGSRARHGLPARPRGASRFLCSEGRGGRRPRPSRCARPPRPAPSASDAPSPVARRGAPPGGAGPASPGPSAPVPSVPPVSRRRSARRWPPALPPPTASAMSRSSLSGQGSGESHKRPGTRASWSCSRRALDGARGPAPAPAAVGWPPGTRASHGSPPGWRRDRPRARPRPGSPVRTPRPAAPCPPREKTAPPRPARGRAPQPAHSPSPTPAYGLRRGRSKQRAGDGGGGSKDTGGRGGKSWRGGAPRTNWAGNQQYRASRAVAPRPFRIGGGRPGRRRRVGPGSGPPVHPDAGARVPRRPRCVGGGWESAVPSESVRGGVSRAEPHGKRVAALEAEDLAFPHMAALPRISGRAALGTGTLVPGGRRGNWGSPWPRGGAPDARGRGAGAGGGIGPRAGGGLAPRAPGIPGGSPPRRRACQSPEPGGLGRHGGRVAGRESCRARAGAPEGFSSSPLRRGGGRAGPTGSGSRCPRAALRGGEAEPGPPRAGCGAG